MDEQTTPTDHHSNTGMAILAYLGILIIIPFLAESHKDPFVKFHLKQGLVLIITEVIAWFLWIVPLGFLIAWLVWLCIFVLIIIGVVNAASGKQKELPVIGHFSSKFNF